MWNLWSTFVRNWSTDCVLSLPLSLFLALSALCAMHRNWALTVFSGCDDCCFKQCLQKLPSSMSLSDWNIKVTRSCRRFFSISWTSAAWILTFVSSQGKFDSGTVRNGSLHAKKHTFKIYEKASLSSCICFVEVSGCQEALAYSLLFYRGLF